MLHLVRAGDFYNIAEYPISVGVTGVVTTTSGWILDLAILVAILGIVSAGIFSFLLWRTSRKSNQIQEGAARTNTKLAELQSEVLRLSAQQNEWLVAQDQPRLKVVSVHVTRHDDALNVKLYPGHGGSGDPKTGFTIACTLLNPGRATIQLVHMKVLLKDPCQGWQTRHFPPPTRPERKYRVSEFLPGDYKELGLFVEEGMAKERTFPNAEITLAYLSGTRTRSLTINCIAPDGGAENNPEAMLIKTRDKELPD